MSLRGNLFQNVLSQTNAAFKRRPIIYGLSLAAMEGMFCDYFTQTFIERKTELQWYRLKTFACFNSVIMSMDYAIINKFLPMVIHRTGLLAVAQKVFIYEILFAPLWYFPIFYFVQQALHDQNNFSLQSFQTGLQHYRQNYKSDIPAMWSIWIPACFMVFGLAPKHLVLPFMVCVDVSWLVGLSLYRGDIQSIFPKHNDTDSFDE